MCADVFLGFLKRKVCSKEIHGIRVVRQAPKISHLFFANDSFLFTHANHHKAEKIIEMLQQYQNSSGQVVNLKKSEASFSGNLNEEVKYGIRSRMRVKLVMCHSKYLGLLVVFGRSKREFFAIVVEKVWKKIKGWKEKFLSKYGKEVLIKVVTQAIATYIMGCYKLPKALL